MNIIILGSNRIGSALAESLASEANDITVVDLDEERLRAVKDRLDVGTVAGYASHPDILRQAGCEDADMLIAVTDMDEVNLVACQVAHSLYQTPKKICRLRSPAYFLADSLFDKNRIPVDKVISPELIVSDYIIRLIDLPGALQVLDFADGKVQLVAVRAVRGGPLVGHRIRLLREHMPSVDTRVAAIFRRDRPIIPQGDTIIEEGDEVFFVAAKGDIRAVAAELRQLDKSYERVTIAGGGNIGLRIAEKIGSRYHVKIIERSRARCEFIAPRLKRAIAIHGEATDGDVLKEENIAGTDVFLAVTDDDKVNIMSSLLAKRLGAKKVMALISDSDFVGLVQGGEIDIAISPQQATIGSLLAHVRRGDVVNVHSLRRGAAEAMEAVAHGDESSSRVVGRQIQDIALPAGTTIGAIVRDDDVLMAHDDTVVEAEDHVILFVVDRRQIPEVERLFQVGFHFF